MASRRYYERVMDLWGSLLLVEMIVAVVVCGVSWIYCGDEYDFPFESVVILWVDGVAWIITLCFYLWFRRKMMAV